MGISGYPLHICIVCDSKFVRSVNDMCFVDEVVYGTCSECIERKDHDIVDETYDPIKVIGRKTFSKDKKEPEPKVVVLTQEDSINVSKWLTATSMMIETEHRTPYSNSEYKTSEKLLR